jgi:hypothetical protein
MRARWTCTARCCRVQALNISSQFSCDDFYDYNVR